MQTNIKDALHATHVESSKYKLFNLVWLEHKEDDPCTKTVWMVIDILRYENRYMYLLVSVRDILTTYDLSIIVRPEECIRTMCEYTVDTVPCFICGTKPNYVGIPGITSYYKCPGCGLEIPRCDKQSNAALYWNLPTYRLWLEKISHNKELVRAIKDAGLPETGWVSKKYLSLGIVSDSEEESEE